MSKKNSQKPKPAATKKAKLSRQEMIRNATLLENFMVSVFFEHDSEEAREALQVILRVLLGDPGLVVEEFHAEHTMSNTGHHGVRIDVWAKDGQGRQLALELQKETDEELYPRAVFEAATMEVHSLESGHPYTEMVKAIVIFVMQKDLPGKGEPIYLCETFMNGERGAITEAAPTYVFVNGKYRNDKTPLGRMIADILQPDPDKMYTQDLRRRMHMLKRTEEGRKKMETAIDRYMEEHAAERDKAVKKALLISLAKRGLLTLTQAAEEAGMSEQAFEYDMRHAGETASPV